MSKVTGFTQGATSSGMMTWYAAILDCGHSWYSDKTYCTPIQGTEVNPGDEVPCKACQQIAEDIERFKAFDFSNIAYLRYDNRHNSYRVYRHDNTSPTGVLLAASFSAVPEIDRMIDERRLCTMSPTEGRR